MLFSTLLYQEKILKRKKATKIKIIFPQSHASGQTNKTRSNEKKISKIK